MTTSVKMSVLSSLSIQRLPKVSLVLVVTAHAHRGGIGINSKAVLKWLPLTILKIEDEVEGET